MTREELFKEIKRKKSFLCVGLDSDPKKIPSFLNKFDDPVFEFNKRIIDATKRFCVAYKPNIAFYEAQGTKGWESLQKTLLIIFQKIFSRYLTPKEVILAILLTYMRVHFLNR